MVHMYVSFYAMVVIVSIGVDIKLTYVMNLIHSLVCVFDIYFVPVTEK